MNIDPVERMFAIADEFSRCERIAKLDISSTPANVGKPIATEPFDFSEKVSGLDLASFHNTKASKLKMGQLLGRRESQLVIFENVWNPKGCK